MERKIATVLLGVTLTAASMAALMQVSSGKPKSGSSDSTPAATPVSGYGTNPIQDCLGDMFIWRQTNALTEMGGITPSNYDSMSPNLKDARMEVVYACNLYWRATMNKAQQAKFDVTLDPKGHPLPAKWKQMYDKGTQVSALLEGTPEQFAAASKARERFFSRNSDVMNGRAPYKGIPRDQWSGIYLKHIKLLEDDLRAILNPKQTAEFDKIWKAYQNEVTNAISAGKGRTAP